MGQHELRDAQDCIWDDSYSLLLDALESRLRMLSAMLPDCRSESDCAGLQDIIDQGRQYRQQLIDMNRSIDRMNGSPTAQDKLMSYLKIVDEIVEPRH